MACVPQAAACAVSGALRARALDVPRWPPPSRQLRMVLQQSYPSRATGCQVAVPTTCDGYPDPQMKKRRVNDFWAVQRPAAQPTVCPVRRPTEGIAALLCG